MDAVLRAICCLLLTIQINTASATDLLQSSGNPQKESALQPTPQGPTLEDGTPLKLRIFQTISSADAHINDRVEFEVLEDIKVSDVVVIPQGGIAWGTVTEAQPKRRLGRGGSHAAAMTVGIVPSRLLFFPVHRFNS